jgi:proline iminopeptidase
VSTETTPQDNVGIVEVEGAHLRYRIDGHGQTCLVVGSSVYYPRVFSQELRKHLQLVFVDMRHFAASDPTFTPDQISIETYAHDIERVRQTLALGVVVVIGHSIHGSIALEYARRYQEHVRGVVVICAFPRRSDEVASARDLFWEAEASEERKEILARQHGELTAEVRTRLSPADMFVRTYVADGPRFWYEPTYDCSSLWEGVVPNMPLMDRLYGELFKTYDLAQGPGEITVPVLIAHGRYDYAIPHTLWEEHRHKLPRHTYALFERSGHTPPLEEPEQFDQTLLAWVDAATRQ